MSAPAAAARFAWLPIAAVLAVQLALHLACLTRYGWFRDELYYVLCARHLDWGYVDHPPLSVALLAVVRALFGESLPAIRAASAIVGLAVTWSGAELARRLGGGAWAQCLAALAALSAPLFLATQHLWSMNALDQLLWTLATIALLAALRTGRDRDWALLGLVFGLGVLNKLGILWLGAGMGLGLLLTPARAALRTKGPWIAAAIALALAAPHVAWQLAHDWPTVDFMRNATGEKMKAVAWGGFWIRQTLDLNPATLLLWLPGLAALLLGRAGRDARVVGIAFLAVAALLMFGGTSRSSYLAPGFVALFAAGGVAWERWGAARGAAGRFALAAIAIVILALGAVAAPLALPLLPVERFVSYQRALGMAPDSDERHAMGRLPQHFADMHGWPELAAAVARAWDTLTPEERRHAIVFGQNYGQAGAVSVLGAPLGLPEATSGHNSVWLWTRTRPDVETVVIVGGEAATKREVFASVDSVTVASHPDAMPYERDLTIWVCRGPRVSMRELWPRLRHYD